MKNKPREAALAHAIARIGLGINMALHGWTRIPGFATFKSGLRAQFESSPLSPVLVDISAYVIVAAESVIGPLLILGLAQRAALLLGGVLMWVLLFGVCLIQQWSAAGSQMVYLAFFSVLLATEGVDCYSLDNALRRRKTAV